MRLTVDDMAKLGQLYLDNGRWQGTQVVSKAWVRAATSNQVVAGDHLGYGYQWWVKDDIEHPRFAAIGYGGQHIEVVPDLGLVAVFSVRIQDFGQPILEADDWEEVMSVLIIPTLTDPELR
jgi:CubicO group peptidase (beta-lactamase class C family)